MRGTPTIPVPSIADIMSATEAAGQLTNPSIRCMGIAVNTSSLAEDAAEQLLDRIATEYQLPCVDPVRQGADALVDYLDKLQAS